MKKFLVLIALVGLTGFVSCDDDGGDFSLLASNVLENAYADETELFGAVFSAKYDWTVTVTELQPTTADNADWMRLLIDGSERSGDGKGTFPLAVELKENYTGEDRVAKITFSREREKDVIFVITVTQSGTDENGVVPTPPVE